MIRRRDAILAGLGIGAFALAEGLRPRKRLLLLRGTTVEEAVPREFAGWQSQEVSDLIGPEQAGRLAQALYSETVARVYFEESTGAAVMFLAAYGDTQSDLLQLHRPESCYPAVGFTLASATSAELALRGGAVLPIRRVVATTEQRTENIVYWTRLGEMLPQTGGEQRIARLHNAMQGYVPDGILVRCSVLGETQPAFGVADRFIKSMLPAIPAQKRPALVGTDLSRQIA